MLIVGPRKIIVLGMTSTIPVAGIVWLVVHYLLGFRRMGYDVYYVEAHRIPPRIMMNAADDGAEKAAGFIAKFMARFGLGDRWAFHALHGDGRCYGMSDTALRDLYRSADLIINLHGGTVPLPEHVETGRLILLETDPVALEIRLDNREPGAVSLMEAHRAYFTWGLNYGRPDCRVPLTERYGFRPTLPAVVCDLWRECDPDRCLGQGAAFTTVGNWKQRWKDVEFQGEVYHWSKHHEFLKFLDLPRRVDQEFELALGSYADEDERLLRDHGWKVRAAAELSDDVDAYRRYIVRSRGEFTVAKDQNIRLRSGWFSDRSAQYLAAGRPVITQETGFSNHLPTGEGLFGFETMEDAVAAVTRINADYPKHCRAAAELARAYFNYDVVLKKMLEEVGFEDRPGAARRRAAVAGDDDRTPTIREGEVAGPPQPFPARLDLRLRSRWPTTLSATTAEVVLAQPRPRREPVHDRSNGHPAAPRPGFLGALGTIFRRAPGTARARRSRGGPGRGGPGASIIIATFNGLVYTRLCLESLLANTDVPGFEVIVVDNQSTDGTREYLHALTGEFPEVRVILRASNTGFAPAVNAAMAEAKGDLLVLLNNDTIVPPGWLSRLARHLEDPTVGLAGPVTNRAGNEAEIDVAYSTYGEFLEFARDRSAEYRGQALEVPMLTMFCTAFRREVYGRLGPLDERFEVGLFEDEDYCMRARASAYRLVCAEDVFVHHFGQATIGSPVGEQDYGRLFHANRRRWESKWETAWKPHRRRNGPDYEASVGRYREAVCKAVPTDAAAVVVSKGDEALLDLEGRRAWHFPRGIDGTYSGHYPKDSAEAIEHLETLRLQGATHLLIPSHFYWWLDHYGGFREHLHDRYERIAAGDDVMIFDLRRSR